MSNGPEPDLKKLWASASRTVRLLVYVVGFFLFSIMVLSVCLGGTAIHGFAQDGRYFLSNQIGPIIEVSFYQYYISVVMSLGLNISISILIIVIIVGWIGDVVNKSRK